MSTVTSTAHRGGLLRRILGRSGAPEAGGTPRPDEASAPDDAGEAAPPPVRRRRTRHTWATLVVRVREVTKATAVLAVDDEGLVVASSGELAERDGDGIAAHVGLAFSLFERLTVLGESTESVCAQFGPDGTWLTAIRMQPPTGARMTISIVGPYTLHRDDRRRIRDAFERLFATDAPA